MATIKLYRGVTGCMFSAIEREGFEGQFVEREVLDRNVRKDNGQLGSLIVIVCSDGKRRVVSVSIPRGVALIDSEGNEVQNTGLLEPSAWSYFATVEGRDNKDADLLVAAKSVEVVKTGSNNTGGSVFASDIRKVTKTFFSGKSYTHKELVQGYGEGYVVQRLESINEF